MSDPGRQKVQKTDEGWKRSLTPEQYRIMRQKGTETACTGKYWNTKEKGMFACAACGAELFSSDTKFDSGTGWPSFDQAIKGAVLYHEDTSHGMKRIEVTCACCGSHLGHVFDDGPRDTTGKRYCINSVCLNLKK